MFSRSTFGRVDDFPGKQCIARLLKPHCTGQFGKCGQGGIVQMRFGIIEINARLLDGQRIYPIRVPGKQFGNPVRFKRIEHCPFVIVHLWIQSYLRLNLCTGQ